MAKEEEERITSIDIEEWPFAILIVSEDEPEVCIHATLYPSSPSEEDLISLKKELIENMGYDGPEDKLQYIEMSSEEFMKIIEK